MAGPYPVGVFVTDPKYEPSLLRQKYACELQERIKLSDGTRSR